MRKGRHFRSRTFRFALVYICLFSVTVVGLLAIVYWATTDAVSRQIDTTIDAEIRGLAEQYRSGGLVGLVQTVQRRSAARGEDRALYLLADDGFRPLAGNLSNWPDAKPDEEGWITFRLFREAGEGGGVNFGRARVFDLRVGLHLLVGHDLRERTFVSSVIRETFGWGLAAIFATSLIGAWLFSRFFFVRIDRINATAREIMAGDMSRRIPVSNKGDEFDDLAANLNAMLDQITRLFESLQQVSDNIAHDLRSPLARLRSRIDVALLKPQDESGYRQVLSETIEDADKLIATFNALLSIAQIESGASRARFAAMDVGDVLRDVFELYEPLAEDKGQVLRLSMPEGIDVSAQGDRDLVFQALANLLDNAIKFSPASSEIELGVDLQPRGWRLVVADHGPGVPENMREKVKERFFRLESSRSTPGSGLGLSLAAAVADLHGGEMRLADNDPGLRVEILLPTAGTSIPALDS